MNIWLDMDGTFVNLYGVENWLPMLEAEDTTPYEVAKPLVAMNLFARRLNALKRKGYTINIVSWTSKCGSSDYNARVATAKRAWLARGGRSGIKMMKAIFPVFFSVGIKQAYNTARAVAVRSEK